LQQNEEKKLGIFLLTGNAAMGIACCVTHFRVPVFIAAVLETTCNVENHLNLRVLLRAVFISWVSILLCAK